MSTLDQVLIDVIIALVSGFIGKAIGENGKISKAYCNDRQHACQQLVLEKLSTLEKQLKSLTEIVNEKLLGI